MNKPRNQQEKTRRGAHLPAPAAVENLTSQLAQPLRR
jgi:hypothetical protein